MYTFPFVSIIIGVLDEEYCFKFESFIWKLKVQKFELLVIANELLNAIMLIKVSDDYNPFLFYLTFDILLIIRLK